MRSKKAVLAKLTVLAFCLGVVAPLAHATRYDIVPNQDLYDLYAMGFVTSGTISTGFFHFNGSQFTTEGFSITTTPGLSPFNGNVTYTNANCSPDPSLPANLFSCQLPLVTAGPPNRTITLGWDGFGFTFSEQPATGEGTGLRGTPAEFYIEADPVDGTIPEPGSVTLMLTGLAGIGLWRARRRGPQ